MADLSPMRWWGWGDPHHHADLPPAALAALRAELGVPGSHGARRWRSRTCAWASPR